MRLRVIDTNILINLWHGRYPCAGKVRDLHSAAESPRAWLKLFSRDRIVTPVRLEFVGYQRDAKEDRLAQSFLAEFKNLDGGRILERDWAEAERLARRIPRKGRSRDALDCLIRAVCNRLHADLHSDDTGIPR